ncbi:MAG TPA: nitroreductase/quinone reductase family protein [Actinomycetota bacterium]|nr:nitroreductase/quinone reductase family protein [Actinomycetota bacterium]
MDDQGGQPYCYLTTTGRVSGRPHTIEIWFALQDRTLYVLSGGGDRSDWVRNLLRHPEVSVRLGCRVAPGWSSRRRTRTSWPAGWSPASTSRATATTCPAGAARPCRSRSTWRPRRTDAAGRRRYATGHGGHR